MLHAAPTSSRLLATLCVLLMFLGACTEAIHVHDDGGPSLVSRSHSKAPTNAPDHAPGSTPTSTDHCLLCTVMHAAMPSASGLAPVLVRHTQPAIPLPVDTFRVHQVSFDLFSRPPPTLPAPAR